MRAEDVTIGVLNLDVASTVAGPQEDIAGFLRCERTFDFRVKKEIVRGSSNETCLNRDPALIPAFVEAAKKLEARGCKGIVGDCGFIAGYQKELAAAVSIPVISSILMLVPLVYATLPKGKKVGIITASSEKLKEMHFNSVGWSTENIPVIIKGVNELPPDERKRLGDFSKEGWATREQVMCKMAKDLVHDHPEIGALVLECTLLQPIVQSIQKAVNLPIFDITLAARLLHGAVSVPNYAEM